MYTITLLISVWMCACFILYLIHVKYKLTKIKTEKRPSYVPIIILKKRKKNISYKDEHDFVVIEVLTITKTKKKILD